MKQLHKSVSILLACILFLVCFSANVVYANDGNDNAEDNNSFCLTVCAYGNAVVEPVPVSYTDGQTIRQALADSGIVFDDLEEGFIYAVEGVSANYSIFYDNYGWDLDQLASEITALCIMDIDCYSPELLQLTVRMMQYRCMTNNVDKYPAAQNAYRVALEGMCEGANGEVCEELLASLNASIADYESILSGEKYTVSFSAVGQDGNPVESISLKFTDAYGNESISETSQIQVIAGEYDFAVFNGFNRTEGKINVDGTTSVSVTLPSKEWFGNIKVLEDESFVPFEQNSTEHTAVYYINDIASSLAVNPFYARGIPSTSETYLYKVYTGKNGEIINERISWKSTTNALDGLLSKDMEGNSAILEARYKGLDGFTMIQSYSLNFVRVPTLSALQVMDERGGNLFAGFSPTTTEYSFSLICGNYNIEATAFISDGCSVTVNGKKNGSVFEIKEGQNTIVITLQHENGQNRTYTLTISGTQAAFVNFDVSPDTTYQIYTLAGTPLNPEANGSYALVPNEQYYYTSTKDTYFHTTQNFTASDGLTVHVAEPDTEDGLEAICFYDNSSPSFREEYMPEVPFSKSTHNCSYAIPVTAQTLYAQATASEGYTVRAEYASQASASAMSVAINNPVNSESDATRMKNVITVSGYSQNISVLLSRTENGVTYSQDYFVLFKRIGQLSSLSFSNYNGGLQIYNDDGSSTAVFDRDVTSYTIKPQKSEEEVQISASLPNTEMGAKAEINGENIEIINGDFTKRIMLDCSEDEETILITISHEDPYCVPTVYRISVQKLDPVAVTFETDPYDANVFVMNNITGKTVYPQEGVFYMTPGEEHTYTVTKNGYIGQANIFISPQQDGTVSVALDQAEVNTTLEDFSAEWPYFRADANNNGVVDIKTPITAENTFLSWATKLGDGWGGGATGCPIIVDGYLYVYASNYIWKVDTISGKVVAQGEMDRGSSFAINTPTYAEGMIFVGLSDGGVQAFNAATLESLWIYNDPLGGQPNCPIAYYDGYIYTGFWRGETKDAGYVCLSITDEDPSSPKEEKLTTWRYVQQGGFYWAGAYVCDDYVLVGTDDGDVGSSKGYANVLSLDPKNGTLIDKLCLREVGEKKGEKQVGDLRCSITYDTETEDFYFNTKGGYFYRMSVNDDGTIDHDTVRSLQLYNYNYIFAQPAMSTCSPCIYNGRAYIGVSGTGQFTPYSGHNITVIDLDKMRIAYTVRTQGYPQTSGLITTSYDEGDGTVFVYFFDNMTPGKLRIISDKPGQTVAKEVVVESYTDKDGMHNYDTAPILFTPSGEQAQYAICSPIADSYGNIYFKNDSAYLMCLSNTITDLEITAAPEKTDYAPGETFDPSGMIITAHYSNGTSRDVTDYVSYSQEPLTTDDTELEIRFEHTMYQDKNGETGVLYDAPSVTIALSVSDEGSVLKGDIDGNGRINTQDVTWLIGYVLGTSTLEDRAKAAADMNNDTRINGNDVTELIQLVIGQ